MKLSLTPLAMTILLEAIARECRDLRRARDIAREFRRSAVIALRRNDLGMAELYRSESANAWNYAAKNRVELDRLRARLAAARITARAA